MNGENVRSFAEALQKALKVQTSPIRLSKNACLKESFSILCIVCSLRTACLLSTLTASHTSITALQSALEKVQATNVVIAVHGASQQLFVVSKEVFLKRWNSPTRQDLFYAIDADTRNEQDRLQASMPPYLIILLSALSRQMTFLDNKGSSSVEVIVLEDSRADGQSSSVLGVALAGWLLEYEVVYYYDVRNASLDASAYQWTSVKILQEDRDGGGEAESKNSLAGIPLILVVVEIVEMSVFYQFTFPQSITSAVSTKVGVGESGVPAICQAIQTRLASRLERAAESDLIFEVTYQQVMMEHVAL